MPRTGGGHLGKGERVQTDGVLLEGKLVGNGDVKRGGFFFLLFSLSIFSDVMKIFLLCACNGPPACLFLAVWSISVVR